MRGAYLCTPEPLEVSRVILRRSCYTPSAAYWKTCPAIKGGGARRIITSHVSLDAVRQVQTDNAVRRYIRTSYEAQLVES